MLTGVRHSGVIPLGLVLFAVVLSACGDPGVREADENSQDVDYGTALSPVVSAMEQSLQIVEDTMTSIATNTTRYVNGEISESHMRLQMADGGVIFTREGMVQEAILEKIAGISPPTRAERYHELMLEYAVLRKDATKLMGEALVNEEKKIMVAATDMQERADLKNKEVVEEGLRLGYSHE